MAFGNVCRYPSSIVIVQQRLKLVDMGLWPPFPNRHVGNLQILAFSLQTGIDLKIYLHWDHCIINDRLPEGSLLPCDRAGGFGIHLQDCDV